MRKITAFLVGVVGGAIAGWYATKTYYKEQCEVETKAMRDLCDATMAEAREKVQKATNEAQRAADDRQIFAEALTRLGYVGGSNTTPTPVPEEEKTAHPSEEDNYFDSRGAGDPYKPGAPAKRGKKEKTARTDRRRNLFYGYIQRLRKEGSKLVSRGRSALGRRQRGTDG